MDLGRQTTSPNHAQSRQEQKASHKFLGLNITNSLFFVQKTLQQYCSADGSAETALCQDNEGGA